MIKRDWDILVSSPREELLDQAHPARDQVEVVIILMSGTHGGAQGLLPK